MASVWIRARGTKDGGIRYRVEYRLGGRESKVRFGGSFRTKRLATLRAAWIERELAGRRLPKLRLDETARSAVLTFAAAAERWRESRVDVAEGTKIQQRTSINRAVGILGGRPVDELTAQDVAAMVGALHREGRKPSFIRKILQATA